MTTFFSELALGLGSPVVPSKTLKMIYFPRNKKKLQKLHVHRKQHSRGGHGTWEIWPCCQGTSTVPFVDFGYSGMSLEVVS